MTCRANLMQLTPTQRIHALCAFVVPIVLVLMFAPARTAREASGPLAACAATADASQAPCVDAGPSAVALDASRD